MKLSIFTTCSDPYKRGDIFDNSIRCYQELSDEIVIVNGGDGFTTHMRLVPRVDVIYPWHREFSWEFIGQQFQRGYEACSGDVVIHADLDFIFHEKDYGAIRQACQTMLDNKQPAMSFYKYQFILPDRYTLKSRLVIAVNKRDYGNRIRFDSGGDLCQPSLDGKELAADIVPESKIAFWNYEKLLKTEAQIKDDVGRMARAWQRHFGEYKLGGPDDESAYQEWLKMMVGRFKGRQHERLPLEAHPKVMQETIKRLRPDQFGFDGLGHLERNDYAQSPRSSR